MIVDAGGGTVDLSTYSRAGVSEGNRCFQEIAIPQCELLCWDSSNSSDFFAQVNYRAPYSLLDKLRSIFEVIT